MINGLVVGVVVDNKDPDKMNRVRVKYPVDSDQEVESSWVRLMSPMAGGCRGLVMLPEIGTEVVLGFAYRTLTPYVLGAVYNGADDAPENYHNNDGNNDKRVLWSRNDHLVIFDDTAGAEKVELAATAPTALDVKSGPIWHSLDSAEKTVHTYADKHIILEAKETISVKCKDFKLKTSATVAVEAGQTAAFKSGSSTKIQSSSTQTYKAGKVDINPPGPAATPGSPKPTPPHKHPPKT